MWLQEENLKRVSLPQTFDSGGAAVALHAWTDAGTPSEVVEVIVRWRGDMLFCRALSADGSISFGDARGAIPLPLESLGGEGFDLVQVIRGETQITLPAGISAVLRRGEREQTVDGPAAFPAQLGDRLAFEVGEFSVSLSHEAAPRLRLGGMLERAKGAGLYEVVGSALVHALWIAAVAYQVPHLLQGEEVLGRAEQAILMRPYLESIAEREREALREQGESPSAASPGEAGAGERAAGDPGEMGKRDALSMKGRWSLAGPRDNRNVALSREQRILEAQHTGMIDLLQSLSEDAAPAASWGAVVPSGRDAQTVLGMFSSDDVHEASGAGGLWTSGTGDGAGGKGVGIGVTHLGDLGGLGQRFGFGPGGGGPRDGFGSCLGAHCGAGMRQHVTRAPRLTSQGTEVNGHMPAEVIQRIVRQNFGRFRMCYEAGLRDNPGLSGRIVTRFVVDRAGAVSQASDGGSDLPNPSVIACVERAFYGLSFPEHEGGVVRVVYPILFSPE